MRQASTPCSLQLREQRIPAVMVHIASPNSTMPPLRGLISPMGRGQTAITVSWRQRRCQHYCAGKSLWDEANSALRVINEGMSHIQSLLSEKEDQLIKLRNLLESGELCGDRQKFCSLGLSYVFWVVILIFRIITYVCLCVARSSLTNYGLVLNFNRRSHKLRLQIRQRCQWTPCQTLGKPLLGLTSCC